MGPASLVRERFLDDRPEHDGHLPAYAGMGRAPLATEGLPCDGLERAIRNGPVGPRAADGRSEAHERERAAERTPPRARKAHLGHDLARAVGWYPNVTDERPY